MLSVEQKQKLGNWEKVTLENMNGKNGKKFSATSQVDAANRRINFSSLNVKWKKS